MQSSWTRSAELELTFTFGFSWRPRANAAFSCNTCIYFFNDKEPVNISFSCTFNSPGMMTTVPTLIQYIISRSPATTMRLLNMLKIRSSGNLKLRAASLLSLCKTSFTLLTKFLFQETKIIWQNAQASIRIISPLFFSELCCAWSREAGTLSRSFASLFASRSPSTMVREALKEQEH